MQKAIIHTATRVIRRLTTDADPGIASDESVVDLAQDINLDGGPWKLDNSNVKTTPTAQEIDDSDIDEAKLALKRKAKLLAFQDAIQDIIDNIDAATLAQTKTKIKAFFQALKNLR